MKTLILFLLFVAVVLGQAGKSVTSQGVYNINDYAGANDSIKLAAALSALGTEVSLYFPPLKTYNVGTQTIDCNVIIPKGATFTIDSKDTLAFTGTIQAGLYQIFDEAVYTDAFADAGYADLTGATLDRIYLQWWGGSPDISAVADSINTRALHRAINAQENGKVDLTNGTWYVGWHSVTREARFLTNGVTLECNGILSIIDNGTKMYAAFQIWAEDITILRPKILGNWDVNTDWGQFGVQGGIKIRSDTDDNPLYRAKNVTITGGWIKNVLQNGIVGVARNLIIDNIAIDSCGEHGLYLANAFGADSTRVTNVQVRNCRITALGFKKQSGDGIKMRVVQQVLLENIYVDAGDSADNSQYGINFEGQVYDAEVNNVTLLNVTRGIHIDSCANLLFQKGRVVTLTGGLGIRVDPNSYGNNIKVVDYNITTDRYEVNRNPDEYRNTKFTFGTGTDDAGVPMQVNNTSGVKYIDCEFNYTGQHQVLSINTAIAVNVTDCIFNVTTSDTLVVFGYGDAQIIFKGNDFSNSTLSDAGDPLIHIIDAGDAIITNNIFSNLSDEGILISTSSKTGRILIANNIADSITITHKMNIRSASYTWTASGSGTNEYYLRASGDADPEFGEAPLYVYINSVAATKAALGSLADTNWNFGDNDSLGYETVYIRLDAGDPDGQASGYVQMSFCEVRDNVNSN